MPKSSAKSASRPARPSRCTGDDTTVGKLLARVLKEHQLTCIERDDGTLVVVRAKR